MPEPPQRQAQALQDDERRITPTCQACWRCGNQLYAVLGGYVYVAVEVLGTGRKVHIECARRLREEIVQGEYAL